MVPAEGIEPPQPPCKRGRLPLHQAGIKVRACCHYTNLRHTLLFTLARASGYWVCQELFSFRDLTRSYVVLQIRGLNPILPLTGPRRRNRTFVSGNMVGEVGIEPTCRGNRPRIFPLDDSPVIMLFPRVSDVFIKCQNIVFCNFLFMK